MKDNEIKYLQNAIDTMRYFRPSLWPLKLTARKAIPVPPPAPTTDISKDMAEYHIVKFVEGIIEKELKKRNRKTSTPNT